VGSSIVAGIGQVSSAEAWTRLSADTATVLIDVRTRAEWSFVGVPDLSSLGRQPVFAEWQSFPGNRVDPAFADIIMTALGEIGADRDAELYFICRSGGRSQLAAETMAAAGFARCHNVSDGFEGPIDADRRRGRLAGWKSAGLPWVQG
jgi:rhodanese-related sulfurtransferase